MDRKRIVRSAVFLVVGVGLLWLVFRDTKLDQLYNELNKINPFWIGVSILINILSQFVRGVRWKMLFKPMKYNPRTTNIFLSVIVLAFTNQVIPRGGEIARLGIINRYEKIPLAKLFGTALVERLTDLFILFLIFTALLAWQMPLIIKIIELPEVSMQNLSFSTVMIIIGSSVAFLLVAWLLLRRFNVFERFRDKLQKVGRDIKEGFTSLYKIKGKIWYLAQSVLIYVLWLLMFYVLIFAYPPMKDVSFTAAAFTFGVATSAFLLPIQSGMGAWHFLAIQSLMLFGIGHDTAAVFALMAHAVTNLVHLPLGAIAFAVLPIVNRKRLYAN
ncbi:lysylphosphatidylglycerol synthase transmembrane domain-containing protein [Salinivirga cyanobacteriivorans]